MSTDAFVAVDRFGNIVEERGAPIKWRVVKHSYDSEYSLLEDVPVGRGRFEETCVLTGSQFSLYQYILKHADKQRTIHDALHYDIELRTAMSNKEHFKVAGLLEDVFTYRLYLDYGYDCYTEFVKVCLGKSQTWGAIYIYISSVYLNEAKTATVFARDGEDFKIGQLIRLYPLPVNEVASLLESGVLTFSTSCSSITKLTTVYKRKMNSLKAL